MQAAEQRDTATYPMPLILQTTIGFKPPIQNNHFIMYMGVS